MRVFIGVELQESAKEALLGIQKELHYHCTRGNYTAKNNFHLTLQFIGEVSDSEIRQLQSVILKTAEEMQPFDNLLNTLGEFQKKQRSVVWVGTDAALKLTELYDNLHHHLSHSPLQVNKGSYIPHISLGRNLLLMEPFEKVAQLIVWQAIPIKINNITLFESIRLNGRLVYRPLYKINMND